jgi:hypothetical protein
MPFNTAAPTSQEPDRFQRTEEGAPDSGDLRVSDNTKHESGIPPARARIEREMAAADTRGRLEAVLSDVARTEANLQALLRGLKHLTAGANAALDSTTQLFAEVEALRESVDHGEQDEGLGLRVRELALELEAARAEAARERHFLIEQQDLFLSELIDDHERQLEALETRADVSDLIAQRDQARDYARRCEQERDLAWQELGAETPSLRPRPELPRPNSAARRGSGAPPPASDAAPATEPSLPAFVSRPPQSSKRRAEYSFSSDRPKKRD